jgi:GPH family glycoside/pentoside/hexuronide:cation symporter
LASFRFIAAFSGGMIVQASATSLVKYFGGGDEAAGWQATMAVFAIGAAVLFLATFATTKERVQPPKTQQTSLRNDLKDLVRNTPWVLLFLIGITLLTYVSIRNGSIMYYFKYFVQDQTVSLFGQTYSWTADGLASAFMVFGSAANIAGVVLTNWVSRHFGKKPAFIGIMIISSVLTIIFFVLTSENVILMFLFQVAISFLMGPLSPLLWSMYTDAADYSEWKFGRRATGLVMSASTMAQKFGWTIGGAMAGWLLASFGFQANIDQTPDTLTGIKLMISVIPAVWSIIGAVITFLYPLDNKMMLKIENELKARREKE